MLVIIGATTLGMFLHSRRGARGRHASREGPASAAPVVPSSDEQGGLESPHTDISARPPDSNESPADAPAAAGSISERPAWQDKTAVDTPVVTSARVVAAPVATPVESVATATAGPQPPDPPDRRGPRHGRRSGRGRKIALRLAIGVGCLIVLAGLTVGGIKLYSSLHHEQVASADRSSTEVWNLTRGGAVVHRVTVETSDPGSLATGACRIALWSLESPTILEKSEAWTSRAIALGAPQHDPVDLYRQLLSGIQRQQATLSGGSASGESYTDSVGRIVDSCTQLGVTGW